MNKQKILAALTTVVLTGSTLYATPLIYAQTPGASPHINFFQELIQFIAQKFGLDKTQVQSAITDFQKQKRTSMMSRPTLTPQQITDREKTRLDQLVKDGKITLGQEAAIINEQALLRTKYNLGSNNNETLDQRKTQMTAMRDEIVTWAKSQGIDSSYVFSTGFGGRGRGPGMMMGGYKKGWGEWNETISPTPSQ